MSRSRSLEDRAWPPSNPPRRLEEVLDDGHLRVEGGRVSAANPALARMLRLSPAALRGRPLCELFCDAHGSPLSEITRSDPICLRDAEGDLVPVTVRSVEPGAFLIVDRSRERRLEHEVWRLTQRLRRREGNGEEPAAPLATEAVSMIEHEMRTACTAVSGYLRLALDPRAGALPAKIKGYLDEAGRALESVSGLLDDLVRMAQPDAANERRVLRKPLALGPLLRAAVDSVRPLAEERGSRIRLEVTTDEDGVFADAGRLEQAMVNLLANALKFAPPGELVRMEMSALELDGGDWLCVSIQDLGPGVRADEAERIFQAFTRGSAASEGGTRGVGLGLAICRRVIQDHGGSIEAIPSDGGGLFRVLLPVAS